MQFNPEKDPCIIPSVLTQILDTCVNGITLSDPEQPDNPIVFANGVFCEMTGYDLDEIIGRNCRFLHGDDRDQEGLEEIREALKNHSDTKVLLRNYKKNGELFYNQLTIQPLRDSQGNLLYYLGAQYDVTDLITAQREAERMSILLDQGSKSEKKLSDR
ncbi:PAS domain-containing protein [Spiribacter sp. C176]|uniref:PAS domain-containing protein n=1 Tax=Spiribacter salilacus TaxID=2664894 RepID=A0A6N7QVT1_9GAMM|nr:PAS domain-containing protein [Spiribacter salilacus]MRH78427.1 PAS domain-containing protein [Spiribacter salilacus]